MNMTKPCILTSVGRCPTCGQVGCASPTCFSAMLRRHEAPPVIRREVAARLIGGLATRHGWSRRRAEQRVSEWFTVTV